MFESPVQPSSNSQAHNPESASTLCHMNSCSKGRYYPVLNFIVRDSFLVSGILRYKYNL